MTDIHPINNMRDTEHIKYNLNRCEYLISFAFMLKNRPIILEGGKSSIKNPDNIIACLSMCDYGNILSVPLNAEKDEIKEILMKRMSFWIDRVIDEIYPRELKIQAIEEFEFEYDQKHGSNKGSKDE